VQAELKQMEATKVGIHNLSPGMVTTELLMSGADTTQSKFFINCMAESADTVADYLVPRIRDVPRKRTTGTNIKFLTPAKAYGNIFARLLFGRHKGRYVPEE
jgi:chlorophyll(ide) b reductase